MFTKSHQGIVKNTVVLEFENGYKITLEKGVEMAMFLAMSGKRLTQDALDGATCAAPDCNEVPVYTIGLCADHVHTPRQ